MSTTSRINKSTTRFVPKRKNTLSSFQRASSTTPSLASVGTATPRFEATGLNPLGGIEEFDLDPEATSPTERDGDAEAFKEPALPSTLSTTGKGKGNGNGFAPRDPTWRETTPATSGGSSSPVRPPTIVSASTHPETTAPTSSRPLSFTPRDPTLSTQPTTAQPTASTSSPRGGPKISTLPRPPTPIASTSKNTIDPPTTYPSLPPTPTAEEDEQEEQRLAATWSSTSNAKGKRVPRYAIALAKTTQAPPVEEEEDSSDEEEPPSQRVIRGKKLQMMKRGQVKRGQTGVVGTAATTKKAAKKDSGVGERRSTRATVVSPEKGNKGKGRMIEESSEDEAEELPRTTAEKGKKKATKRPSTVKSGRGRPAKKSKVADESDDSDEAAGPHEKSATAPLALRKPTKGKGKANDQTASGGLQALLAAANAATEDEDYQMTDDAARTGVDAPETSDDTDSDDEDEDEDAEEENDSDKDGSDDSQDNAIGADGSQKKRKKKSKTQRLQDKTRRLAQQEARPRFVPHKRLKDLDPALTTMSEIATGKDQWDGRVSARGKALLKKHEMTKQERTEKRQRTKRHMKRRQEGLPSDTEDEEQGQVMMGFIEAAHQRGDALPEIATDEEELPDPTDVRPPRQVEIETPEPPSIEERMRAMTGNEEGAAEEGEDDDDEEDRFVETGYAAQVRFIDGEFQIDEASLEVDRAQQARNAQLEPLERVEDNQQNKYTNSASWGKARATAKWTAFETEVFYDALRQFGTDFEMIAGLFPTRTRRQIKSKWVREDKENPRKITAALMNKKEIDLDRYAALTGQDLSGPIPEDPMDRINKHREETEKLERENSVMPGGYGGPSRQRGVPGAGRQVELEDVEEEEGRAARQDGGRGRGRGR
ncbi:hypothetical protein MVLG_01829 [Microbotryum lychnidis-dioicae p1A1 Lamole]|uniref:Myb-like domain-containing protein n=1 Tax=Microbotryum lychnidis-dioicae (strain p1A1 Lamole / MvSl-1064) TaxID=683840 RepID=U5H3A6_USTV1|nr:hypothetical protein MVLG_01829 [Microbotryum lychnidis-dioicae p1A1 Lamole]|eukprot:KDE07919.1 hypothetical protein MVLG_01829 [Microbotryum lychnidis-dioicae p1A1 Lamole]